MFCAKCGSKLSDSAKFCPDCGAPVNGTPVTAKASAGETKVQRQTEPAGNGVQNQSGVAGQTYTTQIRQASAQNQGNTKAVGNQSMVVGCIGAGIVIISLFLPFMTGKVGIFGFSASKSASLMNMAGIFNLTPSLVAIFICVAIIIVCHIRRHPKLSLIGVIALISGGFEMMEYFGTADIGIASLTYGIGFWMYFIGTLICGVAAFMKKNK